jgi:hypothetical protein
MPALANPRRFIILGANQSDDSYRNKKFLMDHKLTYPDLSTNGSESSLTGSERNNLKVSYSPHNI